jgi:hypothetical protein
MMHTSFTCWRTNLRLMRNEVIRGKPSLFERKILRLMSSELIRGRTYHSQIYSPIEMADENKNIERWNLLGIRLPKSEIVYFCQMLVVYIIMITSIINLSLQNGKVEFWLTLLSSAIG